jgi:hypothetical protein
MRRPTAFLTASGAADIVGVAQDLGVHGMGLAQLGDQPGALLCEPNDLVGKGAVVVGIALASMRRAARVIMRGCLRQHGPVRPSPILASPGCPGNTWPS